MSWLLASICDCSAESLLASAESLACLLAFSAAKSESE